MSKSARSTLLDSALRKLGRLAIRRGWLPFDHVPFDDGGGGEKLSAPYQQSVWVQRAIKKISGPIAAVSLEFRDPASETEINNPELAKFWRNPVAGLDLTDFIEACTGWLKLTGEAFIILPAEFAVPFPDRVTAWPKLLLARPDQMRAEKTRDDQVLRWIWQTNHRTLSLPPQQVVQIRFWNPYDPIRGMSEYEAARVASEADYLAGKFALNLSRANGDTGVIISLAEGTPPPDETQRLQITNALRQKRSASLRGEFASVFLPGSLTVQDPKVQSVDAAYAAQRIGNRHEIALAFGVPASMFDVKASYSIGADSDYHQLIIDTCQPTAAKLAAAISAVSERMTGVALQAYFCWDDHPVMQTVRQARIQTATQLFDRGMPWRDISDYLDLDLPEFEGDATGYIPFGLQPVSMAAAEPPPEASPAFAEEDQSPVELIRRAFAERRGEGGRCLCGCQLADLEIRASDTADAKLWKGIVAKRRATIAAIKSKFSRVIFAARSEVMRKLKAGEEKSIVTKAAGDFMFDLAKFADGFKLAIRAVLRGALQDAADQVRAEAGLDDPWKYPDPKATAFLTTRENKLKNVPMDVFERVRGEIQSGLDAGDPLADIAKRVGGTFDEISDKRGAVIAHTETATAFGVGRHEGMVEAGIQWKRWLTSNNNNVRLAHQQMQGEVIALEDYFRVVNPDTGEVDEVLHPADPGGAPWNVINCHCVELAVATPPAGVAEPSA